MPEKNEGAGSALADFSFDKDVSFFGIPAGGEDTADVIKEAKEGKKPGQESTQIKTAKGADDPDDDPEDDDETNEVTFFEDEADKAKPKKDKDEKGKSKPGKKSKEEDEPDDDDEPDEVVEDDPEDEDEDEDDKKGKDKGKKKDKGEDDPEDDEFYSTLTKEMKEKGIFANVELPEEGEEITEEKFFELQEAEIDARVEETIEALLEGLDDDAKEFMRFKKNGGKTSDFLQTYGQTLDMDAFDEEDEEHREAVLKYHLTVNEKLDADELKDRLAYIKSTGKEKTYAAKYYNAIKESEKKEREALVKTQAAAAKKKEQDAETFNTTLSTVLSKTESVGIFPVSKTDQKELGSFITKPTVKVGKNQYVPEFQVKLAKILRAEDEGSKQKLIVLAKLIKEDFNVKDVVTKAKTKAAQEVKSKLKQAKLGTKVSSSGSNNGAKSLSDYFGS